MKTIFKLLLGLILVALIGACSEQSQSTCSMENEGELKRFAEDGLVLFLNQNRELLLSEAGSRGLKKDREFSSKDISFLGYSGEFGDPGITLDYELRSSAGLEFNILMYQNCQSKVFFMRN
jgi:hypothetical protein